MNSPSMLVGSVLRLYHQLAAFGRQSWRKDWDVIATADSNSSREETDYLCDVGDGAGCTEIWEHLSERREEDETDGGG